ncbi:MAG: regulatory protein RecX [Ruminiclostridium sp.]|nr:regulatory protein RecX [Ruminiclostridium sp.]
MEELDIAKRRAMHLLAAREYGRSELIEKLKSNYSEETALTVADLMCEYGYVNDERYAEKLARQCITVRKYGKSRAVQIMRQKGLDNDTIQAALECYSEDDITAEICAILRKKYADKLFLGGLEGRKEMQKVVAALARRGYGYSDIKAALYILQGENEQNAEE